MLNTQQQYLYDKITTLDFNKILVTGEGGTGKTYTLVKALEELIKSGLNVLVCAPTHMARKNMVDNFSEEIRHSIDSRTVASALKKFGFNTGEGSVAFSRGTGEFLSEYDVIAIDEVSMLSERDLAMFLNSNTPTIFTGDSQQLPVVKQKKANFEIFSEKFEHIDFIEQVRQNGRIYDLALKSRNDLYIPQRHDMSPENGLFMTDTQEDLLKVYKEMMLEYRNVYDYRYLCYSNDGAKKVNRELREMLYPDAEAYVAGENLILNENCDLGYNAEVIEVGQVTLLHDDLTNLEYYEIMDIYGNTLRTFSQDDWESLDADIAEKRSEIPKLRSEKKYTLAEEYLSFIELIGSKFKRVSYPYATTIHKAQGQTIKNVFLDTVSIDNGHNKRALMYVGISRASENLWVVEVPLKEWQKQRQANAHYKLGREMYEKEYGEKYYRLRDRYPHPCKTHEDKEYWGWMFKLYAIIPATARAIYYIPFMK